MFSYFFILFLSILYLHLETYRIGSKMGGVAYPVIVQESTAYEEIWDSREIIDLALFNPFERVTLIG